MVLIYNSSNTHRTICFKMVFWNKLMIRDSASIIEKQYYKSNCILESLINIFGKGNFFFPNISFFFQITCLHFYYNCILRKTRLSYRPVSERYNSKYTCLYLSMAIDTTTDNILGHKRVYILQVSFYRTFFTWIFL